MTEFEQEMIARVREVYEAPVPLSVIDDAEEGDRCSSCTTIFLEERVQEDKCPACGAKGFMCSGILVNFGLQEEFINYP